jgi:hypothetical protein
VNNALRGLQASHGMSPNQGGICPCVGDASRTFYCGENNVVQNNATILLFERITVRQDEILPSGRKTYSPTEEESLLMTSRYGGANPLGKRSLRNGCLQNTSKNMESLPECRIP